jgi:ABC-type transport system involved in multi-copper enzyme maturation permease subunit
VILLVRAEVLKLRTTRAAKVLALALAGLVALVVLLVIFKAHPRDIETAKQQQDLLGVGILVPLFGLILGLVIATGEFRHQTITPTLLATPQRLRIVCAKLLAGGIVGLVTAVFIQLLATVLEALALTLRSIPVHVFSGSGFWKDNAVVIVASVCWCALGAAIGTALRNQPATLVVSIIWVLVAEHIFVHFFPTVGKFLPATAMAAFVSRGDADNALSMWPGLIVSFGWVALFGVAAWQLLERRDVS